MFNCFVVKSLLAVRNFIFGSYFSFKMAVTAVMAVIEWLMEMQTPQDLSLDWRIQNVIRITPFLN